MQPTHGNIKRNWKAQDAPRTARSRYGFVSKRSRHFWQLFGEFWGCFAGNQLRFLPPELADLEELNVLKIDDNPWIITIADQYRLGTSHVVEYIGGYAYRMAYKRNKGNCVWPEKKGRIFVGLPSGCFWRNLSFPFGAFSFLFRLFSPPEE